MGKSQNSASATGGRRIDRRVIRTRKAIMDAFDKLVAENGLKKTTVSAIAREADIDRKTFYLHYSSVTDLANRKSMESLERIVVKLRNEGTGKGPVDRIRIALAEVNAILTEQLDLYSHIASSLSIDQIIDMLEQAVRPTIENLGIDEAIMNDEQFRMRFQFYVAGALSLYSTWLTSDRTSPIETVSDTIEKAIVTTSFPTLAAI